MTTNQIMIPLALIGLVVFVGYLILQNRRSAKATTQRHHRPNAPDNGIDDGAIARSVMEGHGAGGGQP